VPLRWCLKRTVFQDLLDECDKVVHTLCHSLVQIAEPLLQNPDPLVQMREALADESFNPIEAGRHLCFDIAQLAAERRGEIVELRAKIPAIVVRVELHVPQFGADRLQVKRQQVED
jgi:hypothetical protein